MSSTLQGIAIDPTPPASGEGLIYNGTAYVPTPANPGDITAVNTTLPLTGGGTSGALTLDINNFTGDSGAGGLDGAVPAPAAGDAAAGKFLAAGGGWAVPAGAFSGVALTRVHTSAAITGLTSTVFAPISFDVEDIDQNGAWVIGSPSLFTIPSNGNYRVQFSAYAQRDAGTSISFQLEIDRAGSPEVASTYLSSNDLVAYKWLTATFTRNFTAGEVVDFGYLFASGDGARSARLFAGAFATLEKLS